jgi:dihydropteroate synthase
VSGLEDPDMVRVIAGTGAGLVLMHCQGSPKTMQDDPHYEDLFGEVAAYFTRRMTRAQAAGIPAERLVLDPGIGFGKRMEHNLALLAGLGRIHALGRPVLVGASRKRFLGELTGIEEPDRRLPASLGAALAARAAGASVFRVHDVAPTREALSVFEAIVLASRADGMRQ